MTRVRVIAAIAAVLSALAVQAVVIGPLAVQVPVSLPAVVVAAVALVDGPGVGLALGFSAGLVADLGSDHPAGVLALSWLALGLVCGMAADSRAGVRRDAAVAAAGSALAAVLAAAVLALVGSGAGELAPTLRGAVPAGLVDALLALAVVPAARALLRSDRLRLPAPVLLLDADR